MRKRPMTPEQFTEHRKALGLSKARCASAFRLGADGRKTVGLWESGANARGIPGPAQELMLAFRSGYRPKGITFPSDVRTK